MLNKFYSTCAIAVSMSSLIEYVPLVYVFRFEQSQAYSPTFVNPCQQLSELFRLLEHEGNLLAKDIDVS